jgi:hypothetical protein
MMVLLLSASCGASQQPVTQSVAGLWFGEGYQAALRTNTSWLMNRKDDGTFRVEFRRYQDCVLVFQQVEEGRWKQDGLRYSTATRSIDGQPFEADDEYRIDEITGTTMRYMHIRSNNQFEARRIPPQVGFPVPANCTI